MSNPRDFMAAALPLAEAVQAEAAPAARGPGAAMFVAGALLGAALALLATRDWGIIL